MLEPVCMLSALLAELLQLFPLDFSRAWGSPKEQTSSKCRPESKSPHHRGVTLVQLAALTATQAGPGGLLRRVAAFAKDLLAV
jgi:hypothetical protein